MSSRPNADRKPPALRHNRVLCMGAGSRLLWAAGALLLLWATIDWALA